MSNQPPIEVPQGAIRLNTDSQKLEFFAQDRWYEMATETASGLGGRAFRAGGGSGGTIIESWNIATEGNAAEFSDKVNSGNNTLAGGSNAVRGLFQGGYATNAISAVTISTFGSAFDFGDQTTSRYTAGASASGTRYVSIAGQPIPAAPINVMEYVEIMTTGNTIDFGDLSRSGYYVSGMSNGHGGLG